MQLLQMVAGFQAASRPASTETTDHDSSLSCDDRHETFQRGRGVRQADFTPSVAEVAAVVVEGDFRIADRRNPASAQLRTVLSRHFPVIFV
jgi:hypothetical protein